jgi:hypothetical protein
MPGWLPLGGPGSRSRHRSVIRLQYDRVSLDVMAVKRVAKPSRKEDSACVIF